MSGISQKAAQVLGDDLLGRLKGVAARSAETNPEVAAEIAAALQNIQHEVKTTIAPDAKELSQEAIAAVRQKASEALDGIEILQTPLAESSGRVLRDSYTIAKGVGTLAGKEAIAEGKVALNAAIDAFHEMLPEIKQTAGVVADNAEILAKDAFEQGKEVARDVQAEALSVGKDKLKTELLQTLIEGKKLSPFMIDSAKMAGIDVHALQGEARASVQLTVDQYHQIAADALTKGDLGAAKKYYVNTFAAATEAEQVLGVLNKFRDVPIHGSSFGAAKEKSYAVLDIYKTGLHRGADLVKTPAEIAGLSQHIDHAKQMVESRSDAFNFVPGFFTLGAIPVARDAIARQGISNLGKRMFTSAAKNAETHEAAHEIAKIASSSGYYDAAASAFERAKSLPVAPPVSAAEIALKADAFHKKLNYIQENLEDLGNGTALDMLRDIARQTKDVAELKTILTDMRKCNVSASWSGFQEIENKIRQELKAEMEKLGAAAP